MPVYTRWGDNGTTFSPIVGERVSKAHPMVELLGEFDEACSTLALAISLIPNSLNEARRDLETIWDMLERVGSSIYGELRVNENDVMFLENICDKYAGETPVALGVRRENVASAAVSLARAVVRRFERRLVKALDEGYHIHSLLLRVVNRMSDALYAISVWIDERIKQ